jgi:alpha-tubulin suppressor-like RCC1 family protein
MSPERVIGGHEFVALSAGEMHTCALTAEGVAYCWGYGQNGEVGNREIMTTCSGALPQPNVPCSQAEPFRVTSDVRFREINAGMRITCAVTVEDDAYCWGSGYRCALALCYDDSHVPLQIPVPGKVRTVDAGYWSACALTMDARAFCWGNNASGQLGSTATIPSCFQNSRCTPEPTEVSGGHRWIALTVAESHACGITTEGDVLCWGDKGEGRLGEGVDTLACDLPSRAWPTDPCSYWPRPVNGLPRIR